MAALSSTLAWRIPWTEKLARLQSMGLQSQTHWATKHMHRAMRDEKTDMGVTWESEAFVVTERNQDKSHSGLLSKSLPSVDWRQSFNFLTTVLESLCILNFYFWSCWVTVAVLELPLIAGRDWGLSWLCSQLLISLASLVAEHRLSVPGLSCPEACGIFPVQTCVLCIGRWTLIHRTIRAVTYMSNIHY